MNNRQKIKEFLISLKQPQIIRTDGVLCTMCMERLPACCMHFHHAIKGEGVNKMLRRKRFNLSKQSDRDYLVEESKKVILLCANCHAKLHDKEL